MGRFGQPCTEEDLDFFYASTTIIVGDEAKTPFWDSPWLKPKEIAPLIFEALSRKSWKVREALKGNAWILKINHNIVVTGQHICEFFILLTLLYNFHLDEQLMDDIVWKRSTNGFYTAAIAYKVQFPGQTLSPMNCMVWKV